MVLKDTEERVIPEMMKPTNNMLLEHISRYYFSTPYVKGRALDIACGSGYGTQMIAKACKYQIERIIGVDLNSDAIEYAKGRYYHPMATYEVRDALDPLLRDKIGTFDTILSFETIEHVAEEELFMNNLHDLLNPGGTLVLSTPFGHGRGIPCGSPFHIHQYTKEEFIDLFQAFSDVEVYYQRGVTIEPPRTEVYYPIGVAVCRK